MEKFTALYSVLSHTKFSEPASKKQDEPYMEMLSEQAGNIG